MNNKNVKSIAPKHKLHDSECANNIISTNVHTIDVSNSVTMHVYSSHVTTVRPIDIFHSFPYVIDNYAECAKEFELENATLYQVDGSLNNEEGRFEWIVDNKTDTVTHRLFVRNRSVSGIPIR